MLFERKHFYYADLAALVVEIRSLSRNFNAAGLEVLVVDSLEHLPRDQAERFIFAITRIWESGLDVALVGPDNQHVSFNEMAEVVKGNEFIRTYVQSYMSEICGSKRLRRKQQGVV